VLDTAGGRCGDGGGVVITGSPGVAREVLRRGPVDEPRLLPDGTGAGLDLPEARSFRGARCCCATGPPRRAADRRPGRTDPAGPARSPVPPSSRCRYSDAYSAVSNSPYTRQASCSGMNGSEFV
jgi:hypothetical protein